MAGYTRQSAASIINGENITAPPINAEFNTLQDAFNGTTGHAHDGTTGNGPKIDLATSVSGFLPASSGGLGGKNNYAATSDPTVGDDINDGYAVGSVWYNVPDDRYYVCVYNAAGAAVWLENRFINSNGDFAPHANNTKDLGHTLKRWKDLFLSGNADIDGSLNVATTTYLGGILTVNANAIFNVGTTTTISNIDVASGAIDNAAIGTTVAASGTFTTLSATTSLTAATADINGGSIDGATVGANSHSTGKFTTLESTGLATLNSVNIDGGAIDGAVIGANSAVAGSFTTISSAGQATLASVDINGGAIDGATIGATSASPITGTTITGTSLVGPVTGNVTGNTSGTHTGPVTGAVTGNLTGNVTSAGTSTFNNVTIDGTLNMNAGTSATITNLSAPTNDNDAARKIDVDNAVAGLVDSAPGTLDTLNELAAALGDDPDFATTITNSIATKLPLAGGTMTGGIAMSTNKITGVGDPTAAQDVSSKAYTDQQDALQVTKTGDSMSGNLAMGSNNITGLATPTANDHAVNKSYADNILGSSTAAATSAANAATSESNAATSATNASNSAAAALTSKNAAATSLATFQNQYLGAQGSAPTQDPDGSALDVGDLYFDTTAGAMKVYSANGWTNAGSSVNGTTNRYSYTATAGQTVFAATYDAGYVDVFLNGVKQVIGSTKDVTATTGTSIVFNSATSLNDVVDIIGYGTFVLADHLTQAQSDARYVNLSGDTMTGDLDINGTLTSDGLTVDGNVALENADNITFKDTSNNNRGILTFDANNDIVIGPAGAGIQDIKFKNNGAKTRLNIDVGGDISFYEDTGTTAKFFWDAADERLGIGTTSPSKEVSIKASGNQVGISIENTKTTNDDNYVIASVDASSGAHLGSSGDELQIINTHDGSPDVTGFAMLANDDVVLAPNSGNVLVGKTSAGLGNDGLELSNTGYIGASISDDVAAYFNRRGNAGDVVSIMDDQVQVGALSTGSGGYMAIRGGNNTFGSGLLFTNLSVKPTNAAGAQSDGAVDLGDTNGRFKDLYLSGDVDTGGVFKGTNGTAAAPTHSFLNDPDNGMFRPTTNTVGFSTAGSEAMRIRSDGRLIAGTQPSTLVDNARVQFWGAKDVNSSGAREMLSVMDDTAVVSGVDTENGGAINFGGKYHTNGSHTTFATIEGVKANGNNGNYAGDLKFRTRTHAGSSSERMRIDNQGRVTTPYQPMVFVTRTATQGVNVSSNNPTTLALDTEIFDIGNDFNTSNYRFTAPTTGRYEISWSYGTNVNSQSVYRTFIWKNGSQLTYTQLRNDSSGTTGYVFSSRTAILPMNVNDYLELRASTDSGTDFYADSNLRICMTIRLIG